ncbi:hypothetical protein J2T55_000811 [Methylohalomonas lacus]|uniref:Uncharacterized protein n=1 Tax=Methylohalomonas lacus TaxID=398773 RepID=A0AAE3HLU8_9GAMM|nr:hypothetical protein [Methylohalomonas lacus]MCS3902807.1 hypothetical protein [Methylohalomonas lacus]
MKHGLIIFCFIVTMPLLLAACAAADKHFWELPDENLSYIALIRTAPRSGTVVVYNPKLCQAVGEACGFFRSHAFAHLMLNHQILSPASYTQSHEDAADCYAARNAPVAEVRAAVDFLADEDREPQVRLTGDPAERAKNIRTCAEAADNWETGR